MAAGALAGGPAPRYLYRVPASLAGVTLEGQEPLPTPATSRAQKTAPEAVSQRASAQATLRTVLASLDDMKAEDTLSIDLTGKSALADTMVVSSGRSHRHVGSIADRIVKDLGEAGVKNIRVEGMPHCDWVLIDAGDVIVHVFRPEVRAFYNIEKMWAPGGLRARG